MGLASKPLNLLSFRKPKTAGIGVGRNQEKSKLLPPRLKVHESDCLRRCV